MTEIVTHWEPPFLQTVAVPYLVDGYGDVRKVVEDKDVDPIDPRNNVDLTFLVDTLDCRPIRA